MSSSCGEPSKKNGWYKSMLAKINHQNRLWEAAVKLADGGKPNVSLPVVNEKNSKIKPANAKLYENMIEDAKIERKRRLEREAKKKQQKKDESEEA